MNKHTLQGLLGQELKGILSKNTFPLYQLKTLTQLSSCRTKALGGHSQYCEKGHLNGVWYNSCKNRSCPQCRGMASEQWLVNTQKVLLDCPHHHIIFTVPHELNSLWRFNRTQMIGFLFKAVQETLKKFSQDPKYLAATPGILSTLHTWGRNLSLHPHLHVLISHGGLNNAGQWVAPKKDSLFPAKPVMMVYRGKLLALLRDALNKETLVLPSDTVTHKVKGLLNKLGRLPWVVHFCARYDYAQGVAKYLARYVKGGPLKNSQLRKVDSTGVTMSYQSHQTKRREFLTLSAEQFIKRILEHIPLPRKSTVRYSGLYTSSLRDRLNQARTHLSQEPVSEKQQLTWQDYLKKRGSAPQCARCGAALVHKGAIAPEREVY